MLTRSTIFAAHHQRENSIAISIVKLTDGTNTYYFSNAKTVIELDSTKIYPALKSWSIPENIDPLNRTWADVTVSIILENNEFKNDSSGNPVRVSDVMTGLIGRDITIYLLSGNGATAFSDCLIRFYGIVTDEPRYDRDSITIGATNKAAIYIRNLPQNLVKDIYANTPDNMKEQLIPLVYGEFTPSGNNSESHDRSGLGLAIAIRTDNTGSSKYVISDHILHTITGDALFIKDSALNDPGIFISPTVTADDSGYGTATAPNPALAYGFVYPFGFTNKAIRGFYLYVDDEEQGYDRNISTAATIKNNYEDDDPGYDEIAGEAVYYITIPSVAFDELKYQAQVSDRISGGSNPSFTVYAGFYKVPGTGLSITYGTGSIITTTTSFGANIQDSSYVPDRILINQSHMTYGHAPIHTLTMLKLYLVRIRMRYAPSDLDEAFVACKGRKYGTWIDSRSSNYSSGDCITDPAGIIESLLRDELGLTDTEIDLASFINAENTSVEMRINITSANTGDSDSIIQRICKQSTFTYFFNAQSMVRLIPLNDNTPTINATIPWCHILNEKITISKWTDIINKMIVSSRWQAEYDSFADVTTYNNTTSQSARAIGVDNGIFKYAASWENLAGTSAAHVANHFIRSADGSASDNDGLWANDHIIIEFETPAFFYSHLQIGDWIELDTSVDPHIKCFGESWSGKQFLITGLTQTADSTKIKAIELF